MGSYQLRQELFLCRFSELIWPLFIFTQSTFYFHSAHATQATIIKWRSILLCPEHLSFDRSCQYFTLPWAPGAPVSPVASSACRAAERMKRAESCKIPRSHSDRQTWRWWPCRSRCCWCWRWSRPASPCLAGVTVEVGLDDCCSPDPDSHFTLVPSSSMSLISLSASSDHRCQAVSSFCNICCQDVQPTWRDMERGPDGYCPCCSECCCSKPKCCPPFMWPVSDVWISIWMFKFTIGIKSEWL